MRAILREVDALPMDRMELRLLPDGMLDVQIRLYADHEAYHHLVAYFKSRGYESRPNAGVDCLESASDRSL